MNIIKPPRHDEQLEQRVLGAILIDAKGCEIHVNTHNADLFFKEQHQEIWKSFKEILRKGQTIDLVSTTQQLRSVGKLEFVGGAYYVSELSNTVTSSVRVFEWILYLKQLFIARWIEHECMNTLKKSNEDTVDSLALLEDHRNRLEKIADFRNLEGERAIEEILSQSIEEGKAREKAMREGRPTGIDTGVGSLNRHIGGWQKGELIVIGARPSMGKSSLALHFAKTSALKGTKTAFFSLEMSDVRLSDKLILSMVAVESNSFKYGRLNAYEWEQIEQSKNFLKDKPLHLFDKAMMTIGQIRSMAKSIEGLGLIVIDYLQLISTDGDRRNRNREQEVSEISRQCKQLAKELNIPIIALSQLNRSVETRGGTKRPTLSDLRESGAIEQDADMVIFLHRQDYYEDVEPQNENMIEAIIAKFRDGATGNVEFKRSNDFTQFFEKEEGFAKQSQLGIIESVESVMQPNHNFQNEDFA